MKKIITSFLVLTVMLLPSLLQAKVVHLLPTPQEVKETGSSFALGRNVTITYAGGAEKCAWLEKFFTDNNCNIVAAGGVPVTVTMVESIDGAHDYELYGFDEETYTLVVTADAIDITAVKPVGIIRAAQTLVQLAEGYEGGSAAIETVEIKDWPAFKLRGYMHDVGRSFISVDELKKHIDLLSRFKVNCFHWHFTENQAWRFEVEGYSQLTSTGSMTRFAGSYYKQSECEDVAAYAKERGVIIIPEIDMPGHSEAFKRAMGFDMQTDNGVEVLKKVLTQVAEVFADAPYIHIGADEKTITYPNFLDIMTNHIHGLGKKVIVWNPISGVNVANTNTDMTQMWSSAGNKIADRPNIDCRYNYTNHFDVFADVVGIYRSNIYYVEQGNKEVAGTISAYWNDRKTPTQEDIIKQNNMYANVIASAERAWIGGGKQYIEKGGTMIPNSGEEFEGFADWERRFLFHKANSLKNEPIPYVKQTNVRWRITDPFPNGGDMNVVFAPETDGKNATADMKESYDYNGVTYNTGMATGAGIYLRHTWGNNTIPTYYGNTNYSNVTSYAWTYVYSDKEQTVGAQIEFQNYGRSEKDKAPDAGKWDCKGSDIWLNGVRIAPPSWDNSGKNIDNEVDLMNENFTARKPVEVKLNKGWNKVFIKLPYVAANGVRLNKWMFTFVLTDLEGKDAVEGLVYSPNKNMDAEADMMAASIIEIKNYVSNATGEQPGEYSPALAVELNGVIATIEATFGRELTAEQRAEQLQQLNSAFENFKEKLKSAEVNMPKVSSESISYYYTMCTPQRGNRYPTSKGAGADIVGETSVADAAKWKFVLRSDGKLDIVNKADGSFISPASSNNTALRTQTASPANGWELKSAETQGLFIIVSGSAQFNQTNNNQLGFKVYNWGSGTNTTDTGCQYLINEVETVNGGEVENELTNEDIVAALAFADDFAGKVGYPTTAEIEKYKAAVNSARTQAELDAAKSVLYSTSNVNVPAGNKKYTLTMVAKNGNRFYMNYTGSDVALVARGEGELPASAVFECEDNSNGTVSLKTADGKYLVYHTDYNGVWWLENSGNTTGLQSVKGADPNSSKTTTSMTDIRFDKIASSNTYVDGTDEQLFGLLAWYSLRGYDTGKSQDTYGYMVMKIDGSNYDGAGAPFWNGSFSSAFLIEEVNVENDIIEIKGECEAEQAVYDLQGRRVESPEKGLYVINGKKVYVK